MNALLASVQYADFLAVTLPAWRQALPDATVRVLTSPADRETARVARRFGAEVYSTNAWTDDGARFNRARALDEAIGDPVPGEVYLSVDADTFPCGTFPAEETFEAGVLYGCARYLVRSASDLAAHLDGRTPRAALPLMDTRLAAAGYAVIAHTPEAVARTAAACLGYFQGFRDTGQRFGSYPTAAGYDTAFAAQFAERRGLLDGYVLHLGPSAGRNWSGRMLPRWRAT